jgi:hypothetical protein
MPRQLLGKNFLTPRAELYDSGNAFPRAGGVRAMSVLQDGSEITKRE